MAASKKTALQRLTPNSLITTINGKEVQVAADSPKQFWPYYGYIYVVSSIVNDKIYIGKRAHKWENWYFGGGTLIKYAIKKHGRDKFSVRPMEFCQDEESLNSAEVRYIYEARRDGKILYNLQDGGTNNWAGQKHSPESIERMRLAQKGHPVSEETRKNISLANAGRVLTEEWKRRIGLSCKGNKHTAEARKKISESHKRRYALVGHHRLGYKYPESVKLKISQSLKKRYETGGPWGNMLKKSA